MPLFRFHDRKVGVLFYFTFKQHTVCPIFYVAVVSALLSCLLRFRACSMLCFCVCFPTSCKSLLPPMSPRGQAKDNATAKPTRAKPKRAPATKQGKKPAATSEVDAEAQEAPEKGSQVLWDDLCTDWLVDWLEDNPEDRQKLFSDSSHDAKKENRARCVAKGAKSAFHVKMAEYVFSVDADPKVCKDVKEDIKKYSKAVENRITQ
jgi:hypothetical protein